MIVKRARSIVLLALIALGALAMLTWTQPWFSIVLNDGSSVEVLGSDAAGSLAALALSIFALVAALSLSTLLIRRILGALAAIVGGTVISVTQSAVADPLSVSSSLITNATGISGTESISNLVAVVNTSVWPLAATSAGALIVAVGLLAVLSAHHWPSATKKYDRTSANVAEDPASQWDAQSRGIDPTAN